jgi:hypothetical protein
MKILAGVLATCLFAAPAFAQDSGKPAEGATPPPSSQTPAAPGAAADASKPADTAAATPEPEQAPEGTTPDKPAAAPQG